MYDQLKANFEKPKTLNQARYHNMVNKGHWAKYIWDFYPMAQDYFHEFNPYFVHLVPNDDLFNFFPFFTVRDGYVAFADFLLKHQKTMGTFKTTFIIPESFVPLVPVAHRERFLTWQVSQPKKKKIKECKKVLIFSLLCEQYFGSFQAVEEKLKELRDLPENVKIEVCLGLRRNPLQIGDPENLNHIVVGDLIRKALPGREIAFVKMKDLVERSVWKETYLLDLMHDQFLVSDSYFWYFLASRGGSISQFKAKAPANSLFDVAVSFEHNLHICPLPESPSKFNDLLFFRKMHVGDLMTNKNFHKLVQASLGVSRPS